ncbi:MAG: hypothetical protein U9R79_15105 [Armatimonadota bacterium]|nr:hypothetical protein [Armatimonadota bacterium]
MRRPTASSRQHTPIGPPHVSPAARLWSELIKPALVIAMVGGGAVLYLMGCARLSVIECDEQRLERLVQDERARELELHRRLAELRTADEIRTHIAQRGLCRPRGTLHVHLTDVPPRLYAALPTATTEEPPQEIRLGQRADEVRQPLLASAPVFE